MDKTKALSDYRLENAKQDLETAKLNCEHGLLAQSVNRSYYAAFHALRALLAFDIFDSKKHSSILGYFNKNYISKFLHILLKEKQSEKSCCSYAYHVPIDCLAFRGLMEHDI